MQTIRIGDAKWETIEAGNRIELTAYGTAMVQLHSAKVGGSVLRQENLTAGQSMTFGPFLRPVRFYMSAGTGAIEYDEREGDAAGEDAQPLVMSGSTLSGASAGAVAGAVTPPPSQVNQMQMAALSVRGLTSAPDVPSTLPTLAAGNRYYIDPLHPSASDANNGTSPETPWMNFHKISGLTPGAGGVIHVAADAAFVYADTWATYKAGTKFPYNNGDNLNGSAVAPVTIRPYYPRGSTSARPRISWYAAMQAGDWTQESGYGGNVWSAAWTKAGNATNGYRKTLVVYGPDNTVAEAPGHDANGPGQLSKPGEYAVDGNKVYFYSPGGQNPVAYYGSVKVLGGNTIFGTAWSGMRYLRVLGLQFELCQAFNLDFASNVDVTHGGVEIGYCSFLKSSVGFFRNQQTFAGGKEMPVSVHDCYARDAWGGAIQLVTAGAGNTVSWEVYRNHVDGCNLNSGFGAFVYNQSKGGTKKVAWGNYFKRALNGVGTQIDGSALYNDLGSNSGYFVGNVVEQSGVAIQANSCTGMWAVANLFIDVWVATQVTGTGTDNTPDMVATIAHNTWLWTGRINRTDLRLGSQMGAAVPVYAHWNDQWLGGGRKFANYSVLNNVAVNAGAAELARAMIRYEGNGITTLAIAGNAVLGLSGGQSLNINNGVVTDSTALNEHITLRGVIGSARKWLLNPEGGSAALAMSSPLIGAGVPIGVEYGDFAGRKFATVPTIGCLEAA